MTEETVLPSLTKFRITLASFISQAGWWTAIVIGFLNNKLKNNAPKIEEPFSIIIPILFVLILILMSGELIFRRK